MYLPVHSHILYQKLCSTYDTSKRLTMSAHLMYNHVFTYYIWSCSHTLHTAITAHLMYNHVRTYYMAMSAHLTYSHDPTSYVQPCPYILPMDMSAHLRYSHVCSARYWLVNFVSKINFSELTLTHKWHNIKNHKMKHIEDTVLDLLDRYFYCIPTMSFHFNVFPHNLQCWLNDFYDPSRTNHLWLCHCVTSQCHWQTSKWSPWIWKKPKAK